MFGVLWVSVGADVMKGTGRCNLALGAIATAQGIGASLSNVAAGYVVSRWAMMPGLLRVLSSPRLLCSVSMSRCLRRRL